MISIQDEEYIRSLIPIYTDFQIWKKTDYNRHMIQYIRHMLKVCADLTEKQLKRIRQLLILRIPVDAIEIQTKINREKILAVRRFYYLHNRKIRDGCRCPTCGRTELECYEQIMEHINGEAKN